jgi:hypothetical protein
MEFNEAIQEYAEEPITTEAILRLLKDYKRPYDKISELVKQEVLTPVKRGVYITGPKLRIVGPQPFLLANHILGPSYVSMESALSYWSLTPERVYETVSMTTTESKTYRTPVGRFSYKHLPLPYYSFGIRRIELTKRQAALIASPEKALCDKIVATTGILLRSIKQVMDFLIEDLRIDEEQLRTLNTKEMSSWLTDAPKRNSLTMLVKTLSNL